MDPDASPADGCLCACVLHMALPKRGRRALVLRAHQVVFCIRPSRKEDVHDWMMSLQPCTSNPCHVSLILSEEWTHLSSPSCMFLAKGMEGPANPLIRGCTVIRKFQNMKLLKPGSSPEPKPYISLMSMNASQHIAWSRLKDSFRFYSALFFYFLWSFQFPIKPGPSHANTGIIPAPLAISVVFIRDSQPWMKCSWFSTINGWQSFTI